MRAAGALRFRLGTRRAELRRARATPLRLRRPFFSPAREAARILARHPADSLDGWESHQPVLVELLRRLPGARVLELGIGYGSTPLVLALSGSSLSLETDERWLRRFERFGSDEHRIMLWRDYTNDGWDCPHFDESWDVAIVDNAPGASRQRNAERLASHTRFVLCHDTEECLRGTVPQYGWNFSAFRYVWTFTGQPTYTTVVSDVEPIPLSDLEGVRGGRGS